MMLHTSVLKRLNFTTFLNVELVPVVNKFANISIPETEEKFLSSSTPFIRIRNKIIQEELTFIDQNIVSPETLGKSIDPIAQKYLPRENENKFGLFWDKHKNYLRLVIQYVLLIVMI